MIRIAKLSWSLRKYRSDVPVISASILATCILCSCATFKPIMSPVSSSYSFVESAGELGDPAVLSELFQAEGYEIEETTTERGVTQVKTQFKDLEEKAAFIFPQRKRYLVAYAPVTNILQVGIEKESADGMGGWTNAKFTKTDRQELSMLIIKIETELDVKATVVDEIQYEGYWNNVKKNLY